MIIDSKRMGRVRLIPELFWCKQHPSRLVAVLWSRNVGG